MGVMIVVPRLAEGRNGGPPRVSRIVPGRKAAVTTDEVASAAAFLLSERSSGINAQGIVVDAGMATNYHDAEVVKHTLRGAWPTEST